MVHLAGAALWAILAVIGFVVIVTESDTLGMSRPGDIAVALGLAVLSPSAGADDATERAAGDSVSVAPAGDPPPR